MIFLLSFLPLSSEGSRRVAPVLCADEPCPLVLKGSLFSEAGEHLSLTCGLSCPHPASLTLQQAPQTMLALIKPSSPHFLLLLSLLPLFPSPHGPGEIKSQ